MQSDNKNASNKNLSEKGKRGDYNKKLIVNASFMDIINASVKNSKDNLSKKLNKKD